MKKLALTAVNTWLSYLFVSRQTAISIVFVLGVLQPVYGDDCASGEVTCLIAAINNANGMTEEHVVTLGPGVYTLPIGLPVITGSIRIQASADDPPTVIERDPGAATQFRIFQVSAGGELTLEGITVQRGNSGFSGGSAILNRGMTSLQDSIVTDNEGELGAINNFGTLKVLRSIIADNFGGHDGGGIVNEAGGNVLVENSTIAHNVAIGAGGIGNFGGSLVVRNSAIIANSTDLVVSGGGILNVDGYLEITNSTIAKNKAAISIFGGGGGGVANSGGQVSVTNSTIRENVASFGGGIMNFSGTLRVQNTIIAGNTGFSNGPDCWGGITTLGNNVVGDPSANCDVTLQPTDLTGDPGLGTFVGGGEDDLPGRAFYPVLAGSQVIGEGNPNACLQTDQLGNLRAGVCDIGAIEFRGPLLVSVDVRPKKDANRINPDSAKNINVAIFSVNGFDATTIDPYTVRFGAAGIEATPIAGAIRDVNGDGYFDMILRFAIQDTGIMCGDSSVSLTGQTSQGLSVIGSSPIKTVQCKKQKVARN